MKTELPTNFVNVVGNNGSHGTRRDSRYRRCATSAAEVQNSLCRQKFGVAKSEDVAAYRLAARPKYRPNDKRQFFMTFITEVSLLI